MFRLGTRKSRLAMVQARAVQQALQDLGAPCRIVELESKGDTDKSTPLYAMDGNAPGVFTKRLEEALLSGEVDLAVHSLKDLPTQLPDGLSLSAVSPREVTFDCLILSQKSVDQNAEFKIKKNA